jgi:hypothetical protein
MENNVNWHRVNEKRALKGKLTVDKIREWRIKQGWNVDYRDVRANGVDLVAWIARDLADSTENRWYEVYEITNWNINSFCTQDRLDGMIKNLNSEENNILEEHKDASVVKIIIFNYRENLRKIGLEHAQDLTTKNHIYIAFGNEIKLEEDEELIEGWVEDSVQKKKR